MQTVSPALFSVGTDERDLRPCIGPDHFVALALHKSDEVLLAPALFHGLPDVVHRYCHATHTQSVVFCNHVTFFIRVCFINRLFEIVFG